LSVYKVCVLILNYQSWNDTVCYIENLKQQKGLQLSILVVDNCSPNGSFENLALFYEEDVSVTVIKSELNGGYAYGNNYGLRYLANHDVDFIVISNNDIVLENRWLLNKLVDQYHQCDNVAFVSPVQYINGKESRNYAAWKIPSYMDDLRASLKCLSYFKRSGRYRFEVGDFSNHSVECLPGSFFLGRKETFFEIGLFDEATFLFCEEIILGYKVKQIGLQNFLIRSLSFNHKATHTIGAIFGSSRIQKLWLDSTCYFQRTYNHKNSIAIFVLRCLFPIWVVENKIYKTSLKGIKWIQNMFS